MDQIVAAVVFCVVVVLLTVITCALSSGIEKKRFDKNSWSKHMIVRAETKYDRILEDNKFIDALRRGRR